MRIACVYLPAFPLQVHVRQAPHLAGSALAVTDGAAPGAPVLVCSRAAWADGVRPGMAATTARAIAPELLAVPADRALYQGALDALVEGLLGCSEVVDTSAARDTGALHRAIYLQVPPRARGASFGQKLLAQLSRQGFRGRVGVADDRFTAYVAAVRVEQRGMTARLDDPERQPPLFLQSCTVVPRGGSAAFLAPLPLSYLPIDADVQQVLATFHIKTLGDFAALPPPSVSRDWIDEDSDFQALASGQGPATLRGVARTQVLARPLVERVAAPCATGDSQSLSFTLRLLCEHVSLRLEGRGRAASGLALRLIGPEDRATALTIAPRRAALSSQELASALGPAILAAELEHPVRALELEVTSESEPGADTGADALELFASGLLGAQEAQEAQQAHRSQPAPAVELLRADRDHAPPPRARWTPPGRRARRHRADAQQMLSFCD